LLTYRDGDIEELVDYKPPAPPEKTGKHRYVAVILVPKNGTTEALDLVAPEERKRWGYEGERAGIREFAGVNGLKVVGEFFFFCFGVLLLRHVSTVGVQQ
jgi:hypothetical protein